MPKTITLPDGRTATILTTSAVNNYFQLSFPLRLSLNFRLTSALT